MDFIAVMASNIILHQPDGTAAVNLKSDFLNAMRAILLMVPLRTILNLQTRAVFAPQGPIRLHTQLHILRVEMQRTHMRPVVHYAPRGHIIQTLGLRLRLHVQHVRHHTPTVMRVLVRRHTVMRLVPRLEPSRHVPNRQTVRR